MTKPELLTKIATLAAEADENGFNIAGTALMLLVRTGGLPDPVAKCLVNTAYLMVDTVQVRQRPRVRQ